MQEDPIHKHFSVLAQLSEEESQVRKLAVKCGYLESELCLVPSGLALSLGCGNPVQAADPKPGELVLHMGCGAVMDLFLSAAKVGPNGKSVGIDVSEEMVERIQEAAKVNHKHNVEFYQGTLDNMPFQTGTFDAAISNCALSMVPDKPKAFAEVYRVLKPGSGRFAISDILIKKKVAKNLEKCLGHIIGGTNAMNAEAYKKCLSAAGFKDIDLVDKELDLTGLYKDQKGKTLFCGGERLDKGDEAALDCGDLNDYLMSCTITAHKGN